MAIWRRLWEKQQRLVHRYRHHRAQREALRLIVARGDVRLLQDAGLDDPAMLLLIANRSTSIFPFRHARNADQIASDTAAI